MAEAPLATRMRPRNFEELVGQRHLFGSGKALTALLEGGHLPSLILWGPAGTGKTTIAYLLAEAVGAEMQQLSAVASGVADARKIMQSAKQEGMFKTVLFVDEVHRWSKAQQDVLLPAVEAGTVTLIGATTENPYFWLVRMIEAGEDPRYIARRMVVHASEDIGMADSRALLVATAAANAVEYVGLPEVAINLAHATIYLASAPKSNSVISAIGRAMEDARSADPVPRHLRDAHDPGAAKLG